mmetsp:Transcript_74361/g.168438  ORF Transcript_74361/g.168438 Transcript_74361/m.168438 type:complete len:216 (+) Transcript_74361:167-814(+)
MLPAAAALPGAQMRTWRCHARAPWGIGWLAVAGTLRMALATVAPAVSGPPGWPACAADKTCIFTAETLAPFVGGEDALLGGDILLSVVSYVFNVTSAPQHYLRGLGNYAALAGKDASRVLGTMSMEEEDVESQDLTGMTAEQWEELFNWVDKFQEKYALVGRLAGWDSGVSIEEINRRSGFTLRPVPLPPQAAAPMPSSGGEPGSGAGRGADPEL